jgi:hypothetical protein
VLGPHWVEADRLLLFANGKLLREIAIPAAAESQQPPGVKWGGELRLPKLAHDVHLVAIALGPGVKGLFWPTAKPYQPLSPEAELHVIGCSGAVWLDVDGDGRRTAAREYAERLFVRPDMPLPELVRALGPYDEAVAAQAGHLFQASGGSLTSEPARAVLRNASPAAQAGLQAYLAMWAECQRARAASAP